MKLPLFLKIAFAFILLPILNNAQGFSWANGFTSISGLAGISSIVVDENNDQYIVGGFSGIVDFDPSVNTYNLGSSSNTNSIFLLKQDASGNFLWVKQFPTVTPNSGWSGGISISVDQFGNIFMFVSFKDTVDCDPSLSSYFISTGGSFHAAIVKLDSLGNFIWAKHFGGNQPVGSNATAGNIKVGSKSNSIYVTSGVTGSIDADPGQGIHTVISSTGSNAADCIIMKLDSAGNFIWAKQITGDNSKGGKLTIDSIEHIYVAGLFKGTVDFDPSLGVVNLTSGTGGSSPLAPSDIFIAKYDSTGNFSWVKQVGDGGTNDAVYDLTLNRFNEIFVTGYFGGTVDFDPGLGTYNLTSNSTRSAFTLKLRNNGDFAWARKTGANVGLFEGRAIASDSVGNVYTALALPNPCDIDPGTGTATVPAGVAVQKLDSSGNFVWGAGWEAGFLTSLALDGSNSVYSTGTFSGPNKDFDPGPGTFLLSGSFQGSGFIHKMCQGTPPNVPIVASDTVACVGDTITLTAATLPGVYQWTRNVTTVLPDTTVSIKVTNSGIYSVRVSGSCPSIGTRSVSFFPVGTPSISLPTGPISVTNGQQAVVTASISNPGSGYTIDWYRNGTLFHTTTNNTLSYTKTASADTLVAVIFDAGNPCYTPDTSNALIVDAVNNLDDPMVTSGIRVSPNPSKGLFTFSSAFPIQKLEITDLTGRVINSAAPRSGWFHADLRAQAPGVYLYIITSERRRMRGKLVVE